MRFRYILLCAVLLVVSAVHANNPFAIKTVVIDAGHGGKDPGAIGPGKTFEKDIALAVALKLGENIQKHFPDVKVIYTRKTDVFLELHERAEIANKAKADLFIAIHCNSSTNDAVYGSSSYVLGLHKSEANLEVAKRENAVILLEDNREKNYEFNPNSPEGHIIMSMKQNAFLEQSILFASKIEAEMENYAKRKSLGVKQAGFYVLYKTTMPGLLAEIGFISNPDEEKFLLSSKGQDQIAMALLQSFKNYKAHVEGSEPNRINAEQEVEEKPAPVNSPKEPEAKPTPASTINEGKVETPPVAVNETVTESKVEEKPKPAEIKPTPVPSPASPKSNIPVEHKAESGVVFKVQLFVLRESLKDYGKLIKLFDEVSFEPLSNGLTRYYGGHAKTFYSANKLLELAISNGYKDAYIVGFKDGKRLTYEQIKAYQSE